MDKRMKILEEKKKREEELKIAKKSVELMLEGGTDSDSVVAIIRDNGNATRQIYHAIGHETLQSSDDEDAAELTGLSEQQALPHHNNQS